MNILEKLGLVALLYGLFGAVIVNIRGSANILEVAILSVAVICGAVLFVYWGEK